MIELRSTIVMSLIAPGLFLAFAGAFTLAWSIEKKRNYLLLLSLACLLFCVGTCVQILHLPDAVYPNAVISSVFYTSAVIAAAEGILRRAGKQFGMAADLAMLMGVTSLILYFCYITPNLIARICVQNLGYGAVFLVASLRMVPGAAAKAVDRVLFWILFIFAVQFFPRTALTVGADIPHSTHAFGLSPFWQLLQASVALLGAALAIAVLAAAIADVLEDLRRERDSDPLTHVLNRRGFEGRAHRLFTGPNSSHIALILCDLDHFKSVNDTYGHHTGDEVLRRFGTIVASEIRTCDIVGRIGGEEFAILMPDTTEDQAATVAERIRLATQEQIFEMIPASRRITGSFGVVECRAGECLPSLMARADQLLYAAKFAGRNRILRTAAVSAEIKVAVASY